MRILALDCATLVTGVAIIEEENLIGEVIFNTGKNHSSRLMPVLDSLLKEVELDFFGLDALAVSTGPGSFTGLRIGLATAKSLSYATGLPLVGVPTLDALARNLYLESGFVCPLLKAGRSEVYTALYRCEGALQYRLTDYLVLSPRELADLLKSKEEKVTMLGDGVWTFKEILLEELGSRVGFASRTHFFLRAANVAWLAWERLRQEPVEDQWSVKPFYIRSSAAEENLKKKKMF